MKAVAALVAAALGLALAGPAGAQDPATARRSYTAQRAEAPKMDGILDDPCWQTVEWASDFVQREPAEGEPPSEQTAFKIVYDDHALYLAYRAYEKDPAAIARHLARRDRFPGDWVEINIDSYHDQRTAFSFTSSVSGTRGDEYISNDGDNWDGNWDPIWQLETHVDAEGWTAEAKIPLSQLRFSDLEEQVWGIQVQRRIFRKEERSVWQPISKNESGWVSRFGELRGIRGIHPQRQVELMPYSVGRAESFEKVPGDPFLDGRDHDAAVGLDGKVGLSSDLTLDFTVNPDFGQVEADPSEVNLTAFETLFSERRPFFVEGRDVLSFQIAPSIAGGNFTDDNLFYSRRVGRAPRFSPDLGAGQYAKVPTATSILGAAKLTGKTQHGLALGLLESMTDREQADIFDSQANRGFDSTVEPFTNFLVGRALQDFDQGNRRVGLMVTALNRNIDSPDLEFLHRAAYATGVDALHQWHDKKWYLAGTATLSHVRGAPEALLLTQQSSAHFFQRPDNDHESVDSTRTSLSGHAGSLRVGKQSGKFIRFESGVAWRSPGFEINDTGFMRRADEVNQFAWAQYSIRNPVGIFRRVSVNANQWVDWDFGGTLLAKRANMNFNTNFTNNWQAGAGATVAWDRVSNTALRGGPSFALPGALTSWAWVNTDYRQRLNFGFGTNRDDGADGSSRYRNLWMDANYRPSNALQITLSPSYDRFRDQLQPFGSAAGLRPDRYILGEIQQRTFALTMRLDYTVRPNLTVQYYGAPFVSAGSYNNFRQVVAPRAGAYADRFVVFGANEVTVDANGDYAVDTDHDGTSDFSFGNPDFNFRDFNSNLVVRWEFLPGSTAFLVWSQARSSFVPAGRFALRSDFDGLFDEHPHDVFLLKISKWMSL